MPFHQHILGPCRSTDFKTLRSRGLFSGCRGKSRSQLVHISVTAGCLSRLIAWSPASARMARCPVNVGGDRAACRWHRRFIDESQENA
jgi:hypothetical protein